MPETMTQKEHATALRIMHGAALCGRVSLLAFVLFVFGGPFNMVELGLSRSWWIVWDALLSSLFFIQHSGMVRRGLRDRMAGRIPEYYQGALFTIASSLVLVVVVGFWQTSGVMVIDLDGPARWMARAVFFAAAAGIGWGAWSLKGFDPYGTRPIQAQLSGRLLQSQPFSIQGPYLWVRHPLYFFVLMMMWSCPDLTADRLLFNLLWSGWIWAGTVLEEKDLVSEFGSDYRLYQRRVPMLIPWKVFKTSHKNNT